MARNAPSKAILRGRSRERHQPDDSQFQHLANRGPRRPSTKPATSVKATATPLTVFGRR